MWGNYREKQGGKAKYLFFDTEGLVSANNKNANKLFAMLLIVSSLMIFNTKTGIDEKGIRELTVISSLSNSIATNVLYIYNLSQK